MKFICRRESSSRSLIVYCEYDNVLTRYLQECSEGHGTPSLLATVTERHDDIPSLLLDDKQKYSQAGMTWAHGLSRTAASTAIVVAMH